MIKERQRMLSQRIVGLRGLSPTYLLTLKESVMKKIVGMLFLFSFACSFPATAGTIDSAGTYHGTLNGVAYNFWTGTGVALTDGATCNGQSVVILLNSNPQFKDMLAILLAAQASGSNVRMYRLADNIQSYYNGVYAYCVITAVSLGDFPLW